MKGTSEKLALERGIRNVYFGTDCGRQAHWLLTIRWINCSKHYFNKTWWPLGQQEAQGGLDTESGNPFTNKINQRLVDYLFQILLSK